MKEKGARKENRKIEGRKEEKERKKEEGKKERRKRNEMLFVLDCVVDTSHSICFVRD